MNQYRLGEMEQRLADLIWEHQPMTTRALTERCAAAFDWKRTTTYTMLKRLCERDIFANQNGTVVTLMSRVDFAAGQSEQFLTEIFNGSLPGFLTAFTRRNKLSDSEIEEIEALIAQHKEG